MDDERAIPRKANLAPIKLVDCPLADNDVVAESPSCGSVWNPTSKVDPGSVGPIDSRYTLNIGPGGHTGDVPSHRADISRPTNLAEQHWPQSGTDVVVRLPVKLSPTSARPRARMSQGELPVLPIPIGRRVAVLEDELASPIRIHRVMAAWIHRLQRIVQRIDIPIQRLGVLRVGNNGIRLHELLNCRIIIPRLKEVESVVIQVPDLARKQAINR